MEYVRDLSSLFSAFKDTFSKVPEIYEITAFREKEGLNIYLVFQASIPKTELTKLLVKKELEIRDKFPNYPIKIDHIPSYNREPIFIKKPNSIVIFNRINE